MPDPTSRLGSFEDQLGSLAEQRRTSSPRNIRRIAWALGVHPANLLTQPRRRR